MDGVNYEDYFDIAIKLKFYKSYVNKDFEIEFDELVNKYGFEKKDCYPDKGWQELIYVK